VICFFEWIVPTLARAFEELRRPTGLLDVEPVPITQRRHFVALSSSLQAGGFELRPTEFDDSSSCSSKSPTVLYLRIPSFPTLPP
jgi:hypothetical protein